MDALGGEFHILSVHEAIILTASMLLGGCFGYVVRALYRRFATTLSNRDAFSSIFPLVTLATILVISVIKSSLALSLGLVGALSIVRFRAAIKEPEEIVYLFFCIAIGIALGARAYLLGAGGLAGFAVFVVGGHYLRRGGGGQELLITIAGPRAQIPELARFTDAVAEAVGRHHVQRLDVEDGEVRYRVAVFPTSTASVGKMVADLESRLPMCRISYVNMRTLL